MDLEEGFEEEVVEVNDKKRRSVFTAYSQEFLISAAFHAVLLLFISMVPVVNEEKRDRIVMTALYELEEEKEEKIIEELEADTEEIVVEETEVEEQSEEIVEVDEVSETETVSEVELAEVETVMAGTNELADAPPVIMGVGAGESAGGGLPFGYQSRTKRGKMRALKRFGGTRGTQNAVEAALRWLAHHQEKDGSWSTVKHGGARNNPIGATSLAVLAFLGAGYSERLGKYRKTVRNGITWLNGVVQGGDHPFKPEHRTKKTGYEAGLTAMALSEATILGSSALTRDNANLVVTWLLDEYYRAGAEKNPANVAWTYKGGVSTRALHTVSSFVALGLKSAKAAGLESMKSDRAHRFFELYRQWLLKVTDDSNGIGYYSIQDKKLDWARVDLVGVFQKQFMGFPKNDPYIVEVFRKQKDYHKLLFSREIQQVYQIYYGTLAAFQHQGKVWKNWNKKFMPALIRTQRKGDPRKLGGSWDPLGIIKWEKGCDVRKYCGVSQAGGRVVVTAMLAMSLEVYYRYDVMN